MFRFKKLTLLLKCSSIKYTRIYKNQPWKKETSWIHTIIMFRPIILYEYSSKYIWSHKNYISYQMHQTRSPTITNIACFLFETGSFYLKYYNYNTFNEKYCTISVLMFQLKILIVIIVWLWHSFFLQDMEELYRDFPKFSDQHVHQIL